MRSCCLHYHYELSLTSRSLHLRLLGALHSPLLSFTSSPISTPPLSSSHSHHHSHGHKNTVQAAQWSPSGNLVATASRDQLVKVFDIRAMKELVTLRGHKKEVCCELLFSSCAEAAG